MTRPLRHGLLATLLVLLVCGVVGLFSWLTYSDQRAALASLTARSIGSVESFSDGVIVVRWPSGSAEVAFENGARFVGRQAEVRFDPANPGRAVIPGADQLLDTDRSLGGVTSALAVALLVIVAGVVRAVLSVRAVPVSVPVRRIRVQSGLMVRSWLEIDGPVERWVPVYYDPALVTLPSPAVVTGVYPSGRAVTRHPRGRRLDNPSQPDPSTVAPRWTAQLRADAVLLIPAPFVGLFWAYLDGTGFTGWLTATVIAAALGLWWAAWRGSDPS